MAWVVTAYVVAATAATPLWGKLGDRHGRKRLLQISLGVFLVASAACGAAQSITELVITRAVQGVGAGGRQAHGVEVLRAADRAQHRLRDLARISAATR